MAVVVADCFARFDGVSPVACDAAVVDVLVVVVVLLVLLLLVVFGAVCLRRTTP